MKAHTSIMIEVEYASFGVAKRARTWTKLSFSSFRWRAAAAFVATWPSSLCTSKSARVREDVLPLRRATSCTTRTASSSLPDGDCQ